jgi:hypothetical protein
MAVPTQAIIPAGVKLIFQSLRHPNTPKKIYVDDAGHVSVVSVKEDSKNPAGASTP